MHQSVWGFYEIPNTLLVAPQSVMHVEQIFYCPTSKWYYLGTNKNIEKASHPLLAHYIFSDMDQFVLMFTQTQRLVI